MVGQARRSSRPGSGVCWNTALRRSVRSVAGSTMAVGVVDPRRTRVQAVVLRPRVVAEVILPGMVAVGCPVVARLEPLVEAAGVAGRPEEVLAVGVAVVRPRREARSAAV